MISDDRDREITLSEIELLKCVRSTEYRKWLDRYENERDNPFVDKAKEGYEKSLYDENVHSNAGLKKYLTYFPNGKYAEKARITISRNTQISEDNKAEFRKNLENIGCVIIFVLFAGVFILCMCNGLSFAESIATTATIAPLGYGIMKLTEQKKK